MNTARITRLPLVLLALVATLFASATLRAQITPFTYPVGTGQALLSDKYDVFVRVGSGPEQPLQTLMSIPDPAGDFRAVELTGRTFSFTHLDYDPAGGALTFRVVKKFGTAANAVTVHPASYGVAATSADGLSATFVLSANQRYLSVHFDAADNKTSPNLWIKHMLCIFIDLPETNQPTQGAPGVVTYTSTTPAATLASASTIFIPAGYHNFRNYTGGTDAIDDGMLKLRSGQTLYLQGGAFVEGLIDRATQNGHKLLGRGILSGRLFPWYNKPGYTGPRYQEIANIGPNDATVEGITMIDSPAHGVVASNRAKIKNFKYIGWHANNDAVRVGSNSEISHSFLRAVDDHFYNFDIWVHDCVLWAGHNGAILTYGWGGDQAKDANGNLLFDADGNPVSVNAYNSGGSLLENIDIIHPEWISLGNNNSLVAAQTGLNYKPHPYNNPTTLTVLQNIRIEGSIPGLVNLKPRSSGNGVPIALKVPLADVGYLGDLFLSNITVNAQFAKGRIRGQLDASTETNDATPYLVKNVEFNNVTVGGALLTNANKATYLDIEAATTTDIRFSSATIAPEAPTAFAATPAPGALLLSWTDNSESETSFELEYSTSASGPWTSVSYPGNATSATLSGLTPGITLHLRLRASNTFSESPWTPTLTAAPLAHPIPAAPDALTVSAPTETTLRLNWSDRSSDETGFEIQSAPAASGPWSALATVPADSVSHTATDLNPGTTYHFRMRAFTPHAASAWSATASGTTALNLPAAPTGLTATAASGTTIDLAWSDNATNETAYQVQRTTSPMGPWVTVATLAANTARHTDTGLVTGRRYTYRVRASNTAGYSPSSNNASATPVAPTLPAGWTSVDLGTPGLAGSATHNASNGTFTLKGSGADIYGTSDSGQFVYTTVTGDVTITAKLESMQNTHSWAKAGVMIRESLAANSVNMFANSAPAEGLPFQGVRRHVRVTTGATTNSSFTVNASAPYWLRLVRTGNIIQMFHSPDGVTWTRLGATNTVVAMSPTILVGLAVTSHNNAVLNTAVFSNVSITQ